MTFGRYRLKFRAGRAVHDPEKMVLPGIIYAGKRERNAAVHIVAVGWWDWHLTFSLGIVLETQP